MVLASPALPDPLILALCNRDLARRVRAIQSLVQDAAPTDSGPGTVDLPPDLTHDLPFLARLLFPHHCRAPFSPLHWHLLTVDASAYFGSSYITPAITPLISTPFPTSANRSRLSMPRRIAIAAPRGHAKSTIASLILPLLALAHQCQPYIVLLSATVRQAAARLRNIRSELETNTLLLQAYPHLADRRQPWSNRALAVHQSFIESYGALSEIRGLNHGGHRPSLIILDDTDATARVRNPLQRESLLHWFDEVVEPLGDRDTSIVVVGTILHPDSLLATLLHRPTWRGTLWKALPEFPHQAHLWTQWMGLLTEPGEPEAAAHADEFFRDHRRSMLEGSRALWPQRDSVPDLYRMMAVQGLAAFRKEKQNDPLPPVQGPWSPNRWSRFVLRQDSLQLVPPSEGHLPSPDAPPVSPSPAILLRHLAIYGYLDPATGRSAAKSRGDYAALVTVGREPGPDPRYFLLDAWMLRAPVEQQIAAVAQAAIRWGWNAFAYEANGFQSVLGPELTRSLREAAIQAGCTPLIPIPITHTQPKELRIERAGLLVQNRRLLFHAHLPPEFIQHAADYPQPGARDDGLDALAAAIELARSRNSQRLPPIRTIPRTG
jgi:predicted phage terminase large subunit-like protein